MTHRLFKLAAVLGGLAGLTACAFTGQGYSRYGDYYAANPPVTHYLRPAPRAYYYFTPQVYGVEAAGTRFQPQPQFVYRPDPVLPRPVQVAETVSRENGVMVHRPKAQAQKPPLRSASPNMRHIQIAPEPAPAKPEYDTQGTYVFEETVRAPAAPVETHLESVPEVPIEPAEKMPEFEYESPAQTSGRDISYIKVGGGSDIADWQACETKTGGYVEWSPEGYTVDPEFDNCMRLKGYKPESEIKVNLAGEH